MLSCAGKATCYSYNAAFESKHISYKCLSRIALKMDRYGLCLLKQRMTPVKTAASDICENSMSKPTNTRELKKVKAPNSGRKLKQNRTNLCQVNENRPLT
jgi:hypothetical protein